MTGSIENSSYFEDLPLRDRNKVIEDETNFVNEFVIYYRGL